MKELYVPHHARGRIFNGHQEYEVWAMKYCRDYAVNGLGIYLDGHRVGDLLLANARIAAEMLDSVDLDQGTVDYEGVTAVALPLAQRSTAGLFEYFNRKKKKSSIFSSRSTTPTSVIVA